MQTPTWKFGDRVIHASKREWGPGTVTKARSETHEGKPCQMVTVRFDRAGVKTLSTAYAHLISADLAPASFLPPEEPAEPTFAGAASSSIGTAGTSGLGPAGEGSGGSGGGGGSGGSGGDWLSAFEAKDPAEVMKRLPDSATDPFLTAEARLKGTLDLYKYTSAPASLLDWGVAQSGLKDPLSRFNRHELERLFAQFCIVRDNHLKKLVQEMRKSEPSTLARLLSAAPQGVQQTLRRLDVLR